MIERIDVRYFSSSPSVPVLSFCLFSTWRRGPQCPRNVVNKSYLTCIQRTLSIKGRLTLLCAIRNKACTTNFGSPFAVGNVDALATFGRAIIAGASVKPVCCLRLWHFSPQMCARPGFRLGSASHEQKTFLACNWTGSHVLAFLYLFSADLKHKLVLFMADK